MSDQRKAIAYIRTSTKRQLLSLTVQRNAIECWAMLAGVDVIAWHTDHGVSGALPMGKRAGLSAAMHTIMDNENICILVAAHRDRLTRDSNSAEEIYGQFDLCGVEFVAVDETIPNSAASKFRQHVHTSINKYKSTVKSEPTANGHLRSLGVQLGGVAGGDSIDPIASRLLMDSVASEARAVADAITSKGGTVPFGYCLADDGVRLVADEAEQAVITAVRAARAAGLTGREIALSLERAGIVRSA